MSLTSAMASGSNNVIAMHLLRTLYRRVWRQSAASV